jgi:pseudaminic acid biosynthesis-associated methylase
MSDDLGPLDIWSGEFGEEWTERHPLYVEEVDRRYRNNFGIPRTELNELFLDSLDRDSRILEIGANVGTQLEALRQMGFNDLLGIELLDYAVETAKKERPDITIYYAEAGNLPFEDDSFDLIFTSGVLIHIPEEQLDSTLQEITRCTRQYVWGYEYFADERTEITYRGQEGMLWKDDYATAYAEHCPLELRKEVRLPYFDESVCDSMFLLECV